MTAIFAIAAALAAIASVVKYQSVYYALIKSFPLEFQDDQSSRYLFPYIALRPSTPLPLQAEFMQSMASFCFAMLCFSFFLFSVGELTGGWVGFLFFLVGSGYTLQYSKTYRENCNRPAAANDKDKI